MVSHNHGVATLIGQLPANQATAPVSH